MALPVCCLVPLERKYIEMVRRWRNQDRIRRNMYNTELITPEQQQVWFDNLKNDPERRYFLFLQTNIPIGVVNYSAIQEGMAYLGYYLGEEHIWPGTGLLLELASLDFAFERLGLDTLMAEVLEFNTGPQRIHDLFGYERLGVRHEATWRDGQPVAAVVFRYCRQNWRRQREDVLRRLPHQVGQAAALLRL